MLVGWVVQALFPGNQRRFRRRNGLRDGRVFHGITSRLAGQPRVCAHWHGQNHYLNPVSCRNRGPQSSGGTAKCTRETLPLQALSPTLHSSKDTGNPDQKRLAAASLVKFSPAPGACLRRPCGPAHRPPYRRQPRFGAARCRDTQAPRTGWHHRGSSCPEPCAQGNARAGSSALQPATLRAR